MQQFAHTGFDRVDRFVVIRLSHCETKSAGESSSSSCFLTTNRYRCQASYDPGSDELDAFICVSWIVIKKMLGVKYLYWNYADSGSRIRTFFRSKNQELILRIGKK